MAYKLLPRGFIRRLADGADIPPHPLNADYQRYQRWVAEGNTPDPDDSVPFTPTDFSNPDNLDATLRAMLRTVATLTGKTLQEARATFVQHYRNLQQ